MRFGEGGGFADALEGGDDVFGRRLTITYFREQTAEEVALESKYSPEDQDGATIEQLRRKLDEVPYKLGKARGAKP